MTRSLLAMLALVCACKSPRSPGAPDDQPSAHAIALRENARFEERVAAVRTELGAAQLTTLDGQLYPDNDASLHREPLAGATGAEVTIERTETGDIKRIGWMETIGSACGSPVPTRVVLFARGDADKVRVVIVEPEVTIHKQHVDRMCGEPGCGAHPGPPSVMVTWLPVNSPEQISVERHPVPYRRVIETCDHPAPPPP